MDCVILNINQSYSLTGPGEAMSITIELPDGEKINVPVTAEQIQLLVQARGEEPEAVGGIPDVATALDDPASSGPHLKGPSPVAFDVEPSPPPMQLEPDPEIEGIFQPEPKEDEVVDDGPKVAWTDLPESLLSPAVRTVFESMRVQQILPANVLAALVESVEKNLAAGANGSVQAQKVGQVLPASAPRKTVPMDSNGYPIIAQAAPTSTDYDPGEVADLDEDGVAQM